MDLLYKVFHLDGMMMYTRKCIVLMLASCVLLFCATMFVGAEGQMMQQDFFDEKVLLIIGAVVFIIAVLTVGGIKYVTPENVLDTTVRKNLYEYIDEYPGSHLREIARELNLKPSNAAWHLRKLEQTNLVRSRAIGGKKVYYLVEGGIESRKEAVAESILRNDNAKRIMSYLEKNPGKHLLEIAHALDLNHHTVKWHIKKMYMAELVEGDTSHSTYPVYYPTETGISSIRNVRAQQSRKAKTAS